MWKGLVHTLIIIDYVNCYWWWNSAVMTAPMWCLWGWDIAVAMLTYFKGSRMTSSHWKIFVNKSPTSSGADPRIVTFFQVIATETMAQRKGLGIACPKFSRATCGSYLLSSSLTWPLSTSGIGWREFKHHNCTSISETPFTASSPEF